MDFNLVELIAEEQESCECKWGNVVPGHACYCHNDRSPYRKCPQWRSGEPYSECDYYAKNEDYIPKQQKENTQPEAPKNDGRDYVLDASYWDDDFPIPTYCPLEQNGDILIGLMFIGDCPGKIAGVIHKDGQEAVEKWIADHPDWMEKYGKQRT